ncbi:MAG: M20/M25/M40 family metallo-hydrolase, partial [Actinomycetota bacterium]
IDVTSTGRAIDPVAMDPDLAEHLSAAAAAAAPDRWLAMPSAAVHDAMFVAEVMPAAMLFVPSIGGISHDFAEDTTDDDLALGAQTLALGAASILGTKR